MQIKIFNKKLYSSILYYIILSLFCAIITHIITIFYFGLFSPSKSYTELSKIYPKSQFSLIKNNDIYIAGKDAFFNYYICPFNIHNKAFHIIAKKQIPNFWSLAFYNYQGNLAYSLNNKLLPNNNLNLTIGSQIELALINKFYQSQTDQDLKSSLMIPRDIQEGFCILKIYAPSPQEKKSADIFVHNINCQILN